MKAVGQRYVQYVNRSYRRSGTLWEGRFRSCLTQEETYLLACQCNGYAQRLCNGYATAMQRLCNGYATESKGPGSN